MKYPIAPEMNPGSSPLTRGKRHLTERLCEQHRLIPAHAGKTVAAVMGSRRDAAHPRSRGENIAASLAAVSMVGSSPLTRGKHEPF